MPEIIMETAVPAKSDDVVAALTTSEGLASFWTDQVRAQPHVNSKAWFGFGPGAETQFQFEVTAITAHEVTWRCTDGPEEWVGTEVSWRLTPAESGTSVRFEHRGWRSADGGLGSCAFVWGQVLARLDGYLATGRPAPYFADAG